MDPGGIEQCWRIAVEITSAAHEADVVAVGAPGRGRGPRPPKAVWEARKMAVYLAVVLADCDYAALARVVGLSRDTIASHCADVREACALDDAAERHAEVLATACTVALELRGLRIGRQATHLPAPDRRHPAGRLAQLEAFMMRVFSDARGVVSDDPATVIRLRNKSSDKAADFCSGAMKSVGA